MDAFSSLRPGATGSPASASTSRSDAAAQRYTDVAIALHWVIAAVVVAQFAWGWSMQLIPKEPAGLRADAFNLHKSIGLLIFCLMVVRLGWRLGHPAPPLTGLPAWQRRMARATHVVLYVALFAMPVAGYLGSVFSGYPVKWFGVTLPAWGWKDPLIKDLMSTLHFCTSFVLLSALGLHLAGATMHAVARDGYVRRMMLRRR